MLALVIILIVSEVFTASEPARLFLIVFGGHFLLLLRVNEHLHALIEQALRLDHIQHVEFDLHSFLDVANSIEEPLCVALRVNIIL